MQTCSTQAHERSYVAQVIARLILFTILTFWSLTVNSQVRLVWRTALTNAPFQFGDPEYVTQTNYTVTASVVDSAGNVVIAGFSLFKPGQGGTCSIMKFDPSGNRLWETVLSTNCMAGADDLAVDQKDRIVVAARLSPLPFENPRPVSLIQLSPDGSKLWQRTADYAPAPGEAQPCSSAVKTDLRCGVFFTYQTLEVQSSPPGYRTTLWASKYSEFGYPMWRTALPVRNHIVSQGEMSRFVTVTPDDGLAIAGWGHTSQRILGDSDRFLIKLTSNGRIKWTSDGQDLPYFNGIIASEFDQLCVAGAEATAFIDLRTGRGHFTRPQLDYTIPMLSTPEGGFLLFRGHYLIKVSRDGRQQWSAETGLSQSILGVVPDGDGGWIIAGGKYSVPSQTLDLVFLDYASNGYLRSQTTFSNFSFRTENPYWHCTQKLHRAPDGSLRLVLNETFGSPYPYTSTTGVGIYSFAIER